MTPNNMDFILKILLLAVGLFIGLPVLAYMIVKFGAAGYFREKNKQTKTRKDHHV